MQHFAEINVNLNNEELRKYINQKLNEAINEALFLVDIERLSNITSMSKSFLEKEILCDPRMKAIERRKEKGKRFYFYRECIEILRQIVDEW